MGINVTKKEVSGEQIFAITSGVIGIFRGNFLNQNTGLFYKQNILFIVGTLVTCGARWFWRVRNFHVGPDEIFFFYLSQDRLTPK